MSAVRACTGLALTAVLLVLFPTARAADKVEIKTVNYEGLGDTIKKFKGKVVVADFWADS